jgi:ligand-binding SRPBCC domain-containing protein
VYSVNVRRLERRQRLPISREEAWRFFCNPWNLADITPHWLRFEVDEGTPTEIHPGVILMYHVQPAPLLRVRWVTEITHLSPGELFVDEQRFGPYKFWHHQHLFRDAPGGVEIQDVVHYSVGYGPLGSLLSRWWVDRKLEEIFDFRAKTLTDLFSPAHAVVQ